MKTPFGTHATEMLGLICRGGRDPLTAQEPSGCTDRGVACLTHFWSERRPTRLGTSNKCPRDPQSTFPEQEQLRDQNQSNPLFSGFFGMIPLLGCRKKTDTFGNLEQMPKGSTIHISGARTATGPKPIQSPFFWLLWHDSALGLQILELTHTHIFPRTKYWWSCGVPAR